MVSNQEDDETPDYQWKIILIGNKRVGKTSISSRYVNDQFDPNQQSSVQVKFARKNLQIPDTNTNV